MPTANDLYRDFLIHREVQITRFQQGLSLLIIGLLSTTEQRFSDRLRESLEKLETVSRGKREKLFREQLDSLRKLRLTAWRLVARDLESQLLGFAESEVEFQKESLDRALGIEGILLAGLLSAAVLKKSRFNGYTLQEWLDALSEQDFRRLEQQIRIGYFEGQTTDEIVRRIRGSRQLRYADGTLQISRKQLESLVHTAIANAASVARESLWNAPENEGLFRLLRWTSVLDGRTTLICMSRDGLYTPLGKNEVPPGLPRLKPPNARPPAHFRCRSHMTPVISTQLLGNRTYIIDTRTPERRRVDFAAEAQRRGVPVSKIRDEWVRDRVGVLPGDTTYEEFLRRQSKKFQDEVLGVTRAELFRSGGLSLDRFVDASGHKYTLQELRAREHGAFELAGL